MENINPDDYFKNIKVNHTKEIDPEYLNRLRDIIKSKMIKAKACGQGHLITKLMFTYKTLSREIILINEHGVNRAVEYQDLLSGIERVEGKAIKITELKNYMRDIPDEVIEKVAELREAKAFDEFFVAFTDYTHETSKHIEKERQRKDPILFGAFLHGKGIGTLPELHNRMYFIADWEDEYCNLTYDKLIEANAKKGFNINIKLINEVKDEDIELYVNEFVNGLRGYRFKQKGFGLLKSVVNKIIGKKNV